MSAVEMSICQADRGCMFTMNCCRCVSITHISCPGIMRASNNHISCPWDNELIQHTISFQCHKRLQTIKSVHSERKNQCSQQGCFRTMTFFHHPQMPADGLTQCQMWSTSQHLKVATAELSVQVLVMSNISVTLHSGCIHQMHSGVFTYVTH